MSKAPSSPGVRQYLARYATAEAALAATVRRGYRVVLIVPAFRELPGFWEPYRPAVEAVGGRVLVIVVVNAARARAAEYWPEHRELLEALRGDVAERLPWSSGGAWLAEHGPFDILAVDRAHPDSCLPDGQGVGLARRIGCDLALELLLSGRVECPYLFTTDADAELPPNYFFAVPEEKAAAIVYPFWHVAGDDEEISLATALYELRLRYYVAGLAHARSPYAFHALGSAMAVHGDAYAAVRGFPLRLAGEDFYLLNKLAKVGVVWRADEHTVSLRSRRSLRTPHGTGVAAAKIVDEVKSIGTTAFYHPRVFQVLELWGRAIERFVDCRDSLLVRRELLQRSGDVGTALDNALDDLGAWAALPAAARVTGSAEALSRRLHTWFDGFRTLKLVHALRAAALPSLGFEEALAAPWCLGAEFASGTSLDVLRQTLADAERRSPRALGIAAMRCSRS